MTKLLDQAIERLRRASKDHWIDDVEAQPVPRLLQTLASPMHHALSARLRTRS
jgi:hypothetical protein